MAKKATKVAVASKIRGVDLTDDSKAADYTANQTEKRAERGALNQKQRPEIGASFVTEKPVTLDDRISNKVIQLA